MVEVVVTVVVIAVVAMMVDVDDSSSSSCSSYSCRCGSCNGSSKCYYWEAATTVAAVAVVEAIVFVVP